MNPFIKSPFAAVLLLLTLLLGGGPALAEKADRSKPVNIEADSVTVDDLRKVSVYLGNVVLVQGTMTLHADKIVVHQDAAGFNSATAYGKPVSFRQKRDGSDEYIEGYADRMQYDGKPGTLQLFDNAHLKRGADDLRGSYISYNSNTEFFESQRRQQYRRLTVRPQGQGKRGNPAETCQTGPGRARCNGSAATQTD